MWIFIALFVATLVIAFATMPKQQQNTPGVGDIEAPIAEEGVEISVLFGTRDIEGPNCVWDGDLKTVAIKAKGGKKG